MPGSLADASQVICEVWNSNLEREMTKIREIIHTYNYIAMNVSTIGDCERQRNWWLATLDYRGQGGGVLKCCPDLSQFSQVSLYIQNIVSSAQINFNSFFNVFISNREDMYSQDSIDLLANSGLQFEKHDEEGIDTLHFAELLMTSGVVLCDSVKWLSFHSGYDFGYLVKLLTNTHLPEEEHDFFHILTLFFPSIYDVKYLMKSCKNLKGG
uniref:poly(A)-specific ribonuclease n=1 Tax=Latimeria chalumnae TaxID=7897 RepID=H2ZSD7_LATCH